jgi:hypothetical protein
MGGANKALYDLRYFYCDGNIGRYSCGLARQTLVPIYRRYRHMLLTE